MNEWKVPPYLAYYIESIEYKDTQDFLVNLTKRNKDSIMHKFYAPLYILSIHAEKNDEEMDEEDAYNLYWTSISNLFRYILKKPAV